MVQFGNLGIDFIGMNGDSNEVDEVDSMPQTMSQHQQQQQQADGDMTAFPQHLGQLPSNSVDQLTVTDSIFIC